MDSLGVARALPAAHRGITVVSTPAGRQQGDGSGILASEAGRQAVIG